MQYIFISIFIFSFLFASKCDEHWAETVTAAEVASVVAEAERPSVRTTTVRATIEEERIARVREVRVVA